MDYQVKAYQDFAARPEVKALAATGEKMNQAFIDTVRSAIYRTWEYVAQDWPHGERVTYTGAIEVCIDADRLWTSIDVPREDSAEWKVKRFQEAVAAEEAIRVALKKYDYGRVLKYLARHIKLGL